MPYGGSGQVAERLGYRGGLIVSVADARKLSTFDEKVSSCQCAVFSARAEGRVSIPVFLSRWLDPLRVMTSAWWTIRSIIAAAKTWSPKTSPQRSKGRFDVRISEACS